MLNITLKRTDQNAPKLFTFMLDDLVIFSGQPSLGFGLFHEMSVAMFSKRKKVDTSWHRINWPENYRK